MSFEDRLRDGFQRASASMPDVPLPWEPTITKAHRARTRRMALLAGAAAIAMGGGAWAATSFGEPTIDRTIAPAVSPTPTGSEQESPSENDEMSRAVRTRVLDWIKALALGDVDTAWSWLSPRTQEHFGGDIEGFRTGMSGLSEGFGAWYGSDPPPETTLRILASSGDGVAGVVEIHGQVTKEGTEELGHDALPVRIVDGEVLVEPFGSDVELAPKEPSSNESYVMGDLPALFEITGTGEVGQVNFFYDGMEDDGGFSHSEGRGKRFVANAAAPHDVGPGPHFVTVATVDDTGGIAVLVVPYFVE